MSFGCSLSDFVTVPVLCWNVYKKCKDSSSDFRHISGEVMALHGNLKQLEELFGKRKLSPEQAARLQNLVSGCVDVLKDLEKTLSKYEGLRTDSQTIWDKIKFGTENIQDFRLKLISQTTQLDTFNNILSHDQVEQTLNEMLAEIRARKRKSSIASAKMRESLSMDEASAWRQIRKELESIGISAANLSEHHQFIITWLKEAFAAGKLSEEDLGDAEGNTAMDMGPGQNLMPPTATTKKNWSPSRVTYSILRIFHPDTDMHDAATIGDVDRVSKLPDSGVNINSRDPRSGGTALHGAAHNGHEAVVKLLLSRGANVEGKQLMPRRGLAPRRTQVMLVLNDTWYILSGRQSIISERLPEEACLEEKKADIERIVDIEKRPTHPRTARPAEPPKEYGATPLPLQEKWAGVKDEDYGWTPLQLAATNGHEAVVQLLLEKGANLGAKDYGWTSLQRAASNGCEAVVRLLLERGADVEDKDFSGWTALQRAASNGHDTVADLILEKGAVIEAKNSSGWTALQLAAANGRVEVTRLLLEKGANIEGKDSHGWTALQRAASGGHDAVVQLLLGNGAYIEAKTNAGWTALQEAASNGHMAVVRTLAEKGADIESRDHGWAGVQRGWTALQLATSRGHQDVVRLLIEKGADIDVKDADGRTAMQIAAWRGYEWIVALLLKSGLDIDARDDFGRTALQLAASRGHEAVVRLLLKNGADTRAEDQHGRGPLHLAELKGHEAVVKALLGKGAAAGSRDVFGLTTRQLAPSNAYRVQERPTDLQLKMWKKIGKKVSNRRDYNTSASSPTSDAVCF